MLTQLVIMSAVVYRLVRFVVIDAIFDGPREKVHDWLLDRKKPWALKVHEGLGCNACMSVWFSALVVWLADAGWVADIFGYDDLSIRMPIAQWLACSTACLVWAIIIDPED